MTNWPCKYFKTWDCSEWRQNNGILLDAVFFLVGVGHDNPARNDDQNDGGGDDDGDNDNDTAIRDIPNPPKVGGSECSQSQ